MKNCLWFDMDGTIYNLYEIPNWLEALRENDMSIFNCDGMGRKSLPQIRTAVNALIESGWEVGVITWAPIGVEYGTIAFSECEMEKFDWLEKNFPEIANLDKFLCLEYGESKAMTATKYAPNAKVQILVDDNKAVRADWRGFGKGFVTVNASRGYVKELVGLVG